MVQPPGRSDRRESTPPPAGSDTRFQYGGRWRRLIAAIIDGIVVYVVTLIVVGQITGATYDGSTGRALVASLAVAVLGFLYYVLQHARWGQTLGKRAMSIRVVRESDAGAISYGQSARRLLFEYLISFVTCGIGGVVDVAWILWDERRQALHDKVAKTVVVKAEPGMPDPYARR